MKRNIGLQRLLGQVLAVSAAGLLAAGCGGNGGDGAPAAGGDGATQRVITADVTAAQGGTFADDPASPKITITIPPGAMIADSQLTVDRILSPAAVGPNQTAASEAFDVRLTTSAGGPPRLFQDLRIEMVASPAPVHPQLGEIADFEQNRWQPLEANFFRPSSGTVVALTRHTGGPVRVVHRTLQRSTARVAEGFDVFMNETFGNENFFGGTMGLHTLLNGTTPAAAVGLGVQVDATKAPADIVAVLTGADLAAKDAALANPVVTQRLIKAGAVIGVKGFYANPADPNDVTMVRAGLTCALCHVKVAKTQFQLTAGPTLLPIGAPSIDGVPNEEMDAGAILALTPFAVAQGQATVDLLNSWGPGKFDIRALPDNPLEDNANNPTATPPLWNFLDLEDQGYVYGWDGLFKNGTTRNALASLSEAAYDLVMHANGAFGVSVGGEFDQPGAGSLPPHLSRPVPSALASALAAAEASQPGNDLDHQKLLDVQSWMHSLNSPAPGPFDEALAEQGFGLFVGRAGCVLCHFTEDVSGDGSLFMSDIPTLPLTGALEIGVHVPSLRGISRTAPYFHDHSAPNVEAVIARFIGIGQVPSLSAGEIAALAEYLKTL